MRIAPLLVASLLAGCLPAGTDSRTSAPASSPTGTVAASPPATQTAGPPTSPPTATAPPTTAPPTTAPPTTAPLPQVRLERFSNLAFASMTGAYQTPDGRWLVTEQGGRVMVFREGDTEATVFLDLRDRVSSGGGEEGLLGLALAPDFERSGILFIDQTAPGPLRTVVSSFTSSGTQADRASEAVILEVVQPFSNHNGGQIAVGPDGFLYVALGDGGSGGDPRGHGQNRDTLLGSLLRLDVGDRTRYAVPPDNPFVAQAGRPEIWAYGLRNPWRFSFDTATGVLWAGDVGQNAWEEVNVVEKGANLGWNVMEGTQCFRTDPCDRAGLVPPVISYPNAGGECSVTGGFVYRGSALPELRGAYVYGDYCSGRIWALRYRDGSVTAHAEIARAGFRIGSFAQDRAGEIYVLQHAPQGGIYRIAR